MKTIIQFIHELGDGGASTLVKDYALHLQKDGYHVTVLMVFPDFNSINLKTIINSRIDVKYVFPNKSVWNRIKNKLAPSYFVSKTIKRLVKELHPIALHAHLKVLNLIKPASAAMYWGGGKNFIHLP